MQDLDFSDIFKKDDSIRRAKNFCTAKNLILYAIYLIEKHTPEEINVGATISLIYLVVASKLNFYKDISAHDVSNVLKALVNKGIVTKKVFFGKKIFYLSDKSKEQDMSKYKVCFEKVENETQS